MHTEIKVYKSAKENQPTGRLTVTVSANSVTVVSFVDSLTLDLQ